MSKKITAEVQEFKTRYVVKFSDGQAVRVEIQPHVSGRWNMYNNEPERQMVEKYFSFRFYNEKMRLSSHMTYEYIVAFCNAFLGTIRNKLGQNLKIRAFDNRHIVFVTEEPESEEQYARRTRRMDAQKSRRRDQAKRNIGHFLRELAKIKDEFPEIAKKAGV